VLYQMIMLEMTLDHVTH